MCYFWFYLLSSLYYIVFFVFLYFVYYIHLDAIEAIKVRTRKGIKHTSFPTAAEGNLGKWKSISIEYKLSRFSGLCVFVREAIFLSHSALLIHIVLLNFWFVKHGIIVHSNELYYFLCILSLLLSFCFFFLSLLLAFVYPFILWFFRFVMRWYRRWCIIFIRM